MGWVLNKQKKQWDEWTVFAIACDIGIFLYEMGKCHFFSNTTSKYLNRQKKMELASK